MNLPLELRAVIEELRVAQVAIIDALKLGNRPALANELWECDRAIWKAIDAAQNALQLAVPR